MPGPFSRRACIIEQREQTTLTTKNLDYECYREAVARHYITQTHWLREGYAPDGYYLKDFCLVEWEGVFHLFHIAGTPGVSCCLPGNEIWFGHAVTKDFQTWETFEPCFYIDPDGWDNGHVFAPFVVENNHSFYMFYTGTSPDNTQRIGLAVSEDLFKWRRVGNQPIIRPEEYDWAFCPTHGGAACRDPHIIRQGDNYWMYYTAVTKEFRGCVARASSKDLLVWKDEGPAYIYSDLRHCESANVQKMGNRYYLFFGGHFKNWSFVVSDNPRRWPNQEPIPLEPGLTGMEVIRKKGPRWLVAFFRQDQIPLHKGFRLFLGILDWEGASPGITQITEKQELQPFGF